MATIKFDQVGLESPGVMDKTRIDGSDSGGEVTITGSEAGTAQLLWAPIEDDSAFSSLHQVSPTVWKFTPSSGVYGTYRVKFIPTSNPAGATVRLFAILTPVLGLRIPALNERSDPNASLINSGAAVVAASEYNRNGEGVFEDGDYGGSYTAVASLMQKVEDLAANSGSGTISSIASTTASGLTVTNPSGPSAQLALQFGSSAGQLVDGAEFAVAQSNIVANGIATAAVASNLSTHTANVANPHSTTKAQVGLSNVTDDAQLKRADNDFAGYTLSTPLTADMLLGERGAGGAKFRMAISALLGLSATYRDAFWDPPSVPSPDDDEFNVDSVLSGAWILSAKGGSASFIRDGGIDMTQSIASGHYRSSVVGSTLLLQIRQNEGVQIYKTLAGALSSHELWTLGYGVPTELGTGVSNNPQVEFSICRNITGAPDLQNRAFIRTGTNGDRLESITVTGGSIISNNVGASHAVAVAATDGLAMRVNHGSAATSNFTGFGFRRNGSHYTLPACNSLQFNQATDKISISLTSNNTTPVNSGIISTIFALHFLRRVSLASGWLGRA